MPFVAIKSKPMEHTIVSTSFTQFEVRVKYVLKYQDLNL